MVKGKKGTRRSKQKYPALNTKFMLKSRADLIDYDYLDKLNDEEKEFLNKFTEEYVSASFKPGRKNLHRTKKMKKLCYDANNARNRDVTTKLKAYNKLMFLEDVARSEDELNELLQNALDSYIIDESGKE